jgi:hypothetical protein
LRAQRSELSRNAALVQLIHHRGKPEGVWRAALVTVAHHLIHHRDKLDGVWRAAPAVGSNA